MRPSCITKVSGAAPWLGSRGRLGFYLQRDWSSLSHEACQKLLVKTCQNMSNILKSSLGQSHRLKRLRRMRRRLPSWSSAWASPKRQGPLWLSRCALCLRAEASPELHLSREHKLMSRKYQHNIPKPIIAVLTTSKTPRGNETETWRLPPCGPTDIASRCQICEDVLSKVYGEEWVETARAKKTTESRDDPLQPEAPLGHHWHTTNPYKLCCISRCETLGHHCLPSLLGMEQTLLAAREKTRTSLEQITAHHSFLQKQRRRNTAMWQSLFFTSSVRRPQKASDLPPNDCPAASCAWRSWRPKRETDSDLLLARTALVIFDLW